MMTLQIVPSMTDSFTGVPMKPNLQITPCMSMQPKVVAIALRVISENLTTLPRDDLALLERASGVQRSVEIAAHVVVRNYVIRDRN
jgi:hypothetical protein